MKHAFEVGLKYPRCGAIASAPIGQSCGFYISLDSPEPVIKISKCPKCHELIFDKENICPYCDFRISEAKLKKKEYLENIASYFCIIGIAIFMISIIAANAPLGILSGMIFILIGFIAFTKHYCSY